MFVVKSHFRKCYINLTQRRCCNPSMDGWVGGWLDVVAGSRIANCNQKKTTNYWWSKKNIKDNISLDFITQSHLPVTTSSSFVRQILYWCQSHQLNNTLQLLWLEYRFKKHLKRTITSTIPSLHPLFFTNKKIIRFGSINAGPMCVEYS